MTVGRAEGGEDLVGLLGRVTGLHVDDHRRAMLTGVLRDQRRATPSPALDDRALFDELVNAATVGETYFFRHGDQLDFLGSEIVPSLLAARPPDHPLQLWSAGCANGAEPYTLAMMVRRLGLQDRVHILATDISVGALAEAAEATYSRWTRRSAALTPYLDAFSPASTTHSRLGADVTGLVTLRQHNLMDPVYPRPTSGSGFDVILCRNVLMHLSPAAVAAVVPRLVAALARGGWLLVAPADPPLLEIAPDGLSAVTLPTGGLVYCRDDGVPLRQSQAETLPLPAPAVARLPARPARPRQRPSRSRLMTPLSARDGTAPGVDAHARCRRARELLASGVPEAALTEAMASAFLDPGLAMAHLTAGLAAHQCGRPQVATRAFRRAGELLGAMDPTAEVALSDGETAATLAGLAHAHQALVAERAP